MRSLLLNSFIALYSICFCLWGIFLSLFSRTGELVHRYTAVPWAKGVLWACGIHVEVRGMENVEPHLPKIYLSNHQSYFDIFALLACLPVHFKFILKQELMKIPLLGWAMKGARYISIDRKDPRQAIKSMNDAARELERGASLLIFPEGTRSKDGRLQPFKSGAFHLAMKSGYDIVPITIIGSRLIVLKGSLKIQKGSFAMIIGRPVHVKAYSKKDINQLMAHVHEAMEMQMKDWDHSLHESKTIL